MKHVPNITIRQPNKKPRDNSKKKEDLEQIAKEIQKNIKEFEGKKNVVERVMGGGGGGQGGSTGSVSVQVPVHIPQFSVPENPSKNNLNDINNTVLESENDSREYHEQQNPGRSFLEIEEIYEENPDEFDDLPDLEPIDEPDILPEDEDEADRMIREAQLEIFYQQLHQHPRQLNPIMIIYNNLEMTILIDYENYLKICGIYHLEFL